MKRQSLFVLGFLLIIVSCKKTKPPVAEDYLLFRWLQIEVVDSVNNRSIIGKAGEQYHPDTIKIYSIGDGPSETGRVLLDSISKKYKAGIGYLSVTLPGPEYVPGYLFRTRVFVYLNHTDTDTFYIDKQPGLGFSYYLNNKFLTTIPPLDRDYPTFYLKK